MENWIGVAVWIVIGVVVGLAMKAIVKRPDATAGHTPILCVLGAFGGVVGGMLGVGIAEFADPTALSLGGMVGAVGLAALATWLYRWGVTALT